MEYPTVEDLCDFLVRASDRINLRWILCHWHVRVATCCKRKWSFINSVWLSV